MLAIRARFDGRNVILPDGFAGPPPGKVILIFENTERQATDDRSWQEAQQAALQKVWDNDEDAVYDSM